jgi:Tfp pilus assembly protein PilO
MNLSIKRIDRICLAIVMGVTLVCGYLAVNWVTTQKQQFLIEREILSKRMEEANVATANLRDLKAALSETQAELKYMNERIPASGKIGLFLRQVDALMSQRDVVMISIRPQAAIEEKDYLKIPIKLAFSGKFVDVYRLMDDIEQMNRIVIMDNMMISRQENMPHCQAELMISVFEQSATL